MLLQLKHNASKYAERRTVFQKSLERKKKAALSQFAHMRKVAMLKANLVTSRLLVSLTDISFVLQVRIRASILSKTCILCASKLKHSEIYPLQSCS